MVTNVKNQAQLLAELIYYGIELVSISIEEFWNTYEDNKGKEYSTTISDHVYHNHQYNDLQCNTWSYSIDGYDYYSYAYLVNHGYDGFDSVSYVFKIKVSTNAEMNAFVDMMSK
jgi:hypothetical protein